MRRHERLHELVATLPAYAGELGTDVQNLPEQQLLDRNPTQPVPHIDALNMATLYGERTDGRGTVGCLVGLTILAYSEEAAEARSRTARELNVSERISLFDVAARALSLDAVTRNALFFGLGADWVDDLVKISKRAVLAALDRTIAGASVTAIGTGSGRRPDNLPATPPEAPERASPANNRTS